MGFFGGRGVGMQITTYEKEHPTHHPHCLIVFYKLQISCKLFIEKLRNQYLNMKLNINVI